MFHKSYREHLIAAYQVRSGLWQLERVIDREIDQYAINSAPLIPKVFDKLIGRSTNTARLAGFQSTIPLSRRGPPLTALTAPLRMFPRTRGRASPSLFTISRFCERDYITRWEMPYRSKRNDKFIRGDCG